MKFLLHALKQVPYKNNNILWLDSKDFLFFIYFLDECSKTINFQHFYKKNGLGHLGV